VVEEIWHPYKKNLFPQTSCNEVGGNAVVTVTTDPPAEFFENKERKEQEFVTDDKIGSLFSHYTILAGTMLFFFCLICCLVAHTPRHLPGFSFSFVPGLLII